MSNTPLSIGAILYPGFEMLDLFGPLEMFSMLGRDAMQIHMIAERAGPVGAAVAADVGIGPKALAEYAFDGAPALDVLLIPGGFGTVPALESESLMKFLQHRAKDARIVASVCTGSALLARAGLLDGRRATSNKQFFALSTVQSDKVEWVERARWVEDGKFFTSSGVSAGMDMTLAIIGQLFGDQTAETVATATEYTWHRDPDNDPFASELNIMARQMQLGD
jgi:transcriptional regulator GlxA family with amidase domain